jgi:hypothetical protein
MNDYAIVVFVHNTVSEYHRVTYDSAKSMFINLARYRIAFRADLDCRESFISYSDDVTMVQLIGFIDYKLQADISTLIEHLKKENNQDMFEL